MCIRDRGEGASALDAFYNKGLITCVLYEVKSGKEATVYCCQAHPSTGVERLAAKEMCIRDSWWTQSMSKSGSATRTISA